MVYGKISVKWEMFKGKFQDYYWLLCDDDMNRILDNNINIIGMVRVGGSYRIMGNGPISTDDFELYRDNPDLFWMEIIL